MMNAPTGLPTILTDNIQGVSNPNLVMEDPSQAFMATFVTSPVAAGSPSNTLEDMCLTSREQGIL